MTDNRIIWDFDGTLTIDDKALGYADKLPNVASIKALNAARTAGFEPEIATARGMKSNGGDLEAIRKNVAPTAENWLNQRGIHVDAIHYGKPWCGPDGWYVDDRGMSLEEAEFRFTGPYASKSVDIVATGREAIPAADLYVVNRQHLCLSRLFPVRLESATPADAHKDHRDRSVAVSAKDVPVADFTILTDLSWTPYDPYAVLYQWRHTLARKLGQAFFAGAPGGVPVLGFVPSATTQLMIAQRLPLTPAAAWTLPQPFTPTFVPIDIATPFPS